MRPSKKSRPKKDNDGIFNNMKEARRRKRELDDDDFDTWKDWDEEYEDISDAFSRSSNY